MKTILLMGISCLLLIGVYGVMNKKSDVSALLSETLANYEASRLNLEGLDKPTSPLATESNSTSKTLDDSHWIDGPLFEKSAGSDLVTERETTEMGESGRNAAPETIKQAAPRQGVEQPVTAPTSEIKQLILELNPDTTIMRKVPVEVA